MKKSIIAAGAASVALAAMPVVGVFANTPVHDNINATLTPGCTVTDSLEKTVNITLTPGNLTTTPAATSVSVTCNSDSWTITALGTSDTIYEHGSNHTANALIAEYVDDSDPQDVKYDYEEIATGTGTSGAASQWAFKVATLEGVTAGADAEASISNGYDSFKTIPTGTAAVIVTGTKPVSAQVKTQYQVYTAPTQKGGIYKGQVTYTVVDE